MATSILALVNNVKSWISAIAVSAGIADASKVPLTNGSGLLDNSFVNWAAPSAIGGTAANTVRGSQFTVTGASGSTKDFRWFTGSVPLWNLFSNSSDNLVLSYYDAAGAYLGDALNVNKSTGVITFGKTNIFTPTQTFSAGLSSAGSITVTGQQVALAPTTPSAGGGFRYDYTSGASVALVSVGPGSNLQFAHAASGTPMSCIYNSGSPLGLQVSNTGVAQGYVLVGTNTAFSSTDRLQVSGNIAASGNASIGGTLKVSSGGSTISRILLAVSSALDTISFAATETKTVTVARTGATVGDQVNVNPSSATPNTNFNVYGYVSAADVVTVVAYNRNTTTSQIFSGNVRVSVIG
ncbi:MAG: hypothetical protein KME43_16240 [Myxacorys chilensis ATA2-1-KO14]|jgi:hypothetical protein|nr:hypothetical protein [Myxacorys chilensis ATA2-1-KO14]